MTTAKLTAVFVPAALGLVALGASLASSSASSGVASGSAAQTSIEGRKRPATVYIKPEVMGTRRSGPLEVLIQDETRSIAGELISISSDAIQLEIKNDRIWIPRENVLAVYYDV